MKLKPLSFFSRWWLQRRKQNFIKQYSQRYLHEELAKIFFDQLWQSSVAARRLYVGPNRVAADLPITLILGQAQTGKSSLMAASRQALPSSSYLNSDYNPIAGRSMPRHYVTSQKLYIELPQYFLVNESAKRISYLEQLLLFWESEAYTERVRQVILTVSLSKILNHSSDVVQRNEEFWISTNLLLSKLKGPVQIYVVVTEIDRLQGFVEFFSDLSVEERQFAFGFALNNSSTLVDQIHQQIFVLTKRLQRRMWWRCKAEHVLSRRLLMAEFSGQFTQACEALMLHLKPLLIEVPKNAQLQLRACCFVSTTQRGSIFDLLLEDCADLALHKTKQSFPILLQSKEYFVRGAFQYFGVLANRSYAFSARASRPVKIPGKIRTFFKASSQIGGIFLILLALVGAAGWGFWKWNQAHVYSVLAKDPVIAYRILASNYREQNTETFVSYEASMLPKTLQHSLVQSAQLNQVIEQNARNYLNQRWQAEVYQYYQKNIAGKYPVVETSQRDIPVNQFNAFYSPVGILMDFDQHYLQATSVQILLSNDSSLITLYEQLKHLHQVLYPNGILNLSFMVYPNTFASGVKQVNFMVAGVRLILHVNGLSAGTFVWPNQQSIQESGFAVQAQEQMSPVMFTGEWSWLRFLSSLNWKTAGSESDYIISPANALFSIQLNANQPIADLPKLLAQLSVPEKI